MKPRKNEYTLGGFYNGVLKNNGNQNINKSTKDEKKKEDSNKPNNKESGNK